MRFHIVNKTSGMDLGIYEAESEASALEALARDAGYRSHADVEKQVGKADLLVTALKESDCEEEVAGKRPVIWEKDGVLMFRGSTLEQFARDFIWECKNEDPEYAADHVISELDAEGDLEGADAHAVKRLRSLLIDSALKHNKQYEV